MMAREGPRPGAGGVEISLPAPDPFTLTGLQALYQGFLPVNFAFSVSDASHLSIV